MAEWDNDKPISSRTKLGLRLLLLMFKIVEPYRFEHRFSKELEDIEKLIRDAK